MGGKENGKSMLKFFTLNKIKETSFGKSTFTRMGTKSFIEAVNQINVLAHVVGGHLCKLLIHLTYKLPLMRFF